MIFFFFLLLPTRYVWKFLMPSCQNVHCAHYNGNVTIQHEHEMSMNIRSVDSTALCISWMNNDVISIRCV